MFLKYLKLIWKTIRFRLITWYSLMFILSSLAVFGFALFLLSSSIQQRDRAEIQEEMEEYAALYQEEGLDALKKEVQEDIYGEGDLLFVRLVGGQNNTLVLGIPDEWEELDLKQLEKQDLHKKEQWIYVSTKDREHVLEIISRRLPDGSLMQVGNSTKEREKLLESFRGTFTIVILSAVLIGFIGGVFLAFRALKPIRNLTHTLQSIIETGKIDERAPVSKTSDELSELTVLFNDMLERIEALINGMRDSLDSVAHELRSPMTRLRGTAEMALQSEQNGENLGEALINCIEESERILTMFNTLLDISEAEAGAMKLDSEKVNVFTLIEEVTELYSYVAEEKAISIYTDVPKDLHLSADRSKIQQIVANLLDNAIKYTPSGGRIDIKSFQKDHQVVITVKDTGIGIPQDELPKIWNRLYRGDNSRSQRGLGLGLSLIKPFIEVHRGSIEVSSELDHGSTFTVCLPVTS